MGERQKCCQAHCRACDQCFGGERAFDRHRVFVDAAGAALVPQPRKGADWSMRGCAVGEDVGLFEVRGRCDVEGRVVVPIYCEREPGWTPAHNGAGSAEEVAAGA